MIEACESTLFSYYINVDGMGFPCSFCEGEDKFTGIDVKDAKNFLKDVWYHPETLKFRDKVSGCKDCNNCRICHAFDLGVGK